MKDDKLSKILLLGHTKIRLSPNWMVKCCKEGLKFRIILMSVSRSKFCSVFYNRVMFQVAGRGSLLKYSVTTAKAMIMGFNST